MKRILIADDEENLRLLVRTTLEDGSCEILEASDGATALELARKEEPDLIVLDWMMPGLSGAQVATRLREDPATREIPVVMLTAKSAREDQELGRILGVVAYLVKPFSPLELVRHVQRILD